MHEHEETLEPELSIIVPVYNEGGSLLLLYENIMTEMQKIDKPWEAIFVNDGSTDGSAEILDTLAISNPRLRIIHLRRNYGQTAAMMAGIDHASGEILIPMDGDLQNDPADIPSLLAKLDEGYDVVSGWRQNRQDNALRRNLPSRIANTLISKVSGVHLHDYGCTLKAYRRSVIKDIKLYGEMHRFVPIYASWLGARVTEIPVRHHPRRHGHSKYGLERILKVAFDLILVKFLAKYATKPIYVFGAFGSLFFVIALFASFYALYLKVVNGTSFIQTPLPLLTVMGFMTGVMSILMGLLAELVMRTYYESQSKPTYLVKRTRNFGDI